MSSAVAAENWFSIRCDEAGVWLHGLHAVSDSTPGSSTEEWLTYDPPALLISAELGGVDWASTSSWSRRYVVNGVDETTTAGTVELTMSWGPEETVATGAGDVAAYPLEVDDGDTFLFNDWRGSAWSAEWGPVSWQGEALSE